MTERFPSVPGGRGGAKPRTTAHSGRIAADIELLLEDLRLRSDRQHPFWAVVEATKKRGP
jgi:hypothetical protein